MSSLDSRDSRCRAFLIIEAENSESTIEDAKNQCYRGSEYVVMDVAKGCSRI